MHPQGFGEGFELHPARAVHQLGNAVPPPLVAMVAAPLLACCGLAPLAAVLEPAAAAAGGESVPGGERGVPGGGESVPGGEESIPGGGESVPGEAWGWGVAQELLLDAAPRDGRRDDLAALLRVAELLPNGDDL